MTFCLCMPNGAKCSTLYRHKRIIQIVGIKNVCYEIPLHPCRPFKFDHKAHLCQEIRLVTITDADLKREHGNTTAAVNTALSVNDSVVCFSKLKDGRRRKAFANMFFSSHPTRFNTSHAKHSCFKHRFVLCCLEVDIVFILPSILSVFFIVWWR